MLTDRKYLKTEGVQGLVEFFVGLFENAERILVFFVFFEDICLVVDQNFGNFLVLLLARDVERGVACKLGII